MIDNFVEHTFHSRVDCPQRAWLQLQIDFWDLNVARVAFENDPIDVLRLHDVKCDLRGAFWNSTSLFDFGRSMSTYFTAKGHNDDFLKKWNSRLAHADLAERRASVTIDKVKWLKHFRPIRNRLHFIGDRLIFNLLLFAKNLAKASNEKGLDYFPTLSVKGGLARRCSSSAFLLIRLDINIGSECRFSY